MNSGEEESLDERPAVCSDSALNDRFCLWLNNLATSCRRASVNGPLPDLQPYRDSYLGTSINTQVSGVRQSNQVLPGQHPKQHCSEVQGLPVERPVERPVEHSSKVLHIVQHPCEALHVAEAQGRPSEMLHIAKQLERSLEALAVVQSALCDAETQTSIPVEEKKENSDPEQSMSSLPDVIYSSSSSSTQFLPTSPDVLSDGAFREDEGGNFGPTDYRDVVKKHRNFCSLEVTATDLSPAASDVNFQRSISFASVTGQPKSQRSDAGKEKQRQFSSGYATQVSKQSENSLAASCEDDSLVFSQSENTKDSLDHAGVSFMAMSTPSLENLSSSETLVNWATSAQKDSATICRENRPDSDWWLNPLEEWEGATSTTAFADQKARGVLSKILEMTVAYEAENVSVEIHPGVCQPSLQKFQDSRTSEEVLNSAMLNCQLADYAVQLLSESLTAAEVEVNLLERLDQLAAQNFARGNLHEEVEDAAMEIGSWSKETQQNCIGRLQVAASCGDKTCGNDFCLFYQELLDDMEDHLRNQTLLYSHLHCHLLKIIVEHSAICSEVRCTVPWCFFFYLGDSDQPEEQISRLLSLYRAFDFGLTREINVAPLDTVQFIQLDETINWPSIQSNSKLVPENDTDFEFLAPSSKFGRIAFYALSLGIVPKLLYIEMQSAIDGTHVWNRLRGLQHPNIVLHLWVYVTYSQAIICSDALTFGDKSLEDVMKEKKTGLPMAELVRVAGDILSAAEYLNRNHVFYLLWTADSVGLMADGLTVRLRDFSCSVDESRVTSDDGELADILCSALPPIIMSPEMFHNDIGRHSEVWGIGCLMFHLAQGSTVHQNLRHSDPDVIRTQVQQVPMASVLCSLQNVPVCNILRQVFVEKSQRLQIEQLRVQLLQLQTS